MNGELPVDWQQTWDASMPTYSEEVCGLIASYFLWVLLTTSAQEAKQAATRNRSEEVLNACAALLPEIIGGSADLTPSNLTNLKVCCIPLR